jgi:hypothetical protein
VVEDVAFGYWITACLRMGWSVVVPLTICVVFYSLIFMFALSCCYRLSTMVFLWYKSGVFGPLGMHLIHSNPHIVHSHLIPLNHLSKCMTLLSPCDRVLERSLREALHLLQSAVRLLPKTLRATLTTKSSHLVKMLSTRRSQPRFSVAATDQSCK